MRRPSCALRSPASWKITRWKSPSLCALALLACAAPPVHADATLTYELRGADNTTTVKKFSTARFFVRIDDPDDAERYLLFEAGKFFPLYEVDQAKGTYSLVTPEVIVFMGPDNPAKKEANAKAAQTEKAPAPVFMPVKKKLTVAGVSCRVIHEMVDDKPVIEHCMANSAKLDLTTREIKIIARTFSMARERKFDWLGVGTEDEEFISIQSRDLNTNRVFKLTSVSTKPLEQDYLRIPREYKKVEPDKQAAAIPSE
jgi:hypothetical protein